MLIKGFGKTKVKQYGKQIINLCKEFSNPYNKLSQETRKQIINLYTQKKTIKEISEIIQISVENLEEIFLDIFENDDIDVDPDFLGLTQSYEDLIKKTIKSLGTNDIEFIKPFMGENITNTHIKLCILITKLEH